MFSLFGSSSPFDVEIEKATSENNTTEQWDVIIDICDKAGANSKNAKDCLRSIMRRIGHNDPHVAMQAITLLDACIKNCGRLFHLEIASRDFETEFHRLLTKVSTPVSQKMRVSLKKWAENEFKTDSQLNLIPSLYQKLNIEGADFNDAALETQTRRDFHSLKDSNFASSKQEEDDIARAIELSLKQKDDSPPSLYPLMESGEECSQKPSTKKFCRKVRALYDFEAAEDNELTFFAGEVINVVDDTDANWWNGYSDRGEGLFPSNFVTADLNEEIISGDNGLKCDSINSTKQKVLKHEIIQIDETKIDRLLHLIHDSNPEDSSQDSEEMFVLEAKVNQMLPMIDSELERNDGIHAKLTQLSTNLVEAINMYHLLMRESDFKSESYGQIPSFIYGQNDNVFSPFSHLATAQQMGTAHDTSQDGVLNKPTVHLGAPSVINPYHLNIQTPPNNDQILHPSTYFPSSRETQHSSQMHQNIMANQNDSRSNMP